MKRISFKTTTGETVNADTAQMTVINRMQDDFDMVAVPAIGQFMVSKEDGTRLATLVNAEADVLEYNDIQNAKMKKAFEDKMEAQRLHFEALEKAKAEAAKNNQ